jgi:sulfide:quinone oxidoreductase
MDSPRTHVLIAGGGVAALEAALALQSYGGDGLCVELVAPETQFWYRPLAVAEPFERGRVRHFDLAQLVAGAGASLALGEVVSVDTERKLAYTASASHSYDALLLACGALPQPALPGALTFRGPADTDALQALLGELLAGTVRRVVFAVPAGAVWSLPAYELVLLTADHLEAHGLHGVVLELVTPESAPLELFGEVASEAVRSLLAESGVGFRPRVYPAAARPGELLLVGGDVIPADRVVAMPRLQGPRIGGIPQTFDGFVPVDDHGRVTGLRDVYAAGDITDFAVKQGGLATQQADAAAMAIASDAGADVIPRPFRPVLRGVLLTGSGPRYVRRGAMGGANGDSSIFSHEPIWWPPAKIAGRYLGPYLARIADDAGAREWSQEDGVVVERELQRRPADRPERLIAKAIDEVADRASVQVSDIMTPASLIVAPEDTIGEVAEGMRRNDVGSALVAEYGRLIGIITSRDMLNALAGRVHPSEARVRQWMTADPVTVTPATTREAALYLMTSHGFHHLPVVDGERLVGKIGMRDVLAPTALPGAFSGVGLGF